MARSLPLAEVSLQSRLCTRCGACCDGTLFAHGALKDDEVQGANEAGLIVRERDGKSEFAQPCARLDGRCCAVYPSRPSTCVRFRCVVLKRLDAGEIEFDEAMKLVERLGSAVATVRARLGGTSDGPAVAELLARDAGATDAVGFRRLNASVLLALGRLQALRLAFLPNQRGRDAKDQRAHRS